MATAQTNVAATEQIAASITLAGVDADGDNLTYSLVDLPTNGTATLDGLIVTYTSNSDTATSDSFTFKVNDGTVDSAKATVSIAIEAVNDAPLATEQSITTIEDISIDIILSGTDVDSAALTFAIVTSPTNGKITLDSDKVTYNPTTGYFGSDSFTFKANDGNLDSENSQMIADIPDIDQDGVLNDDDKCPDTPPDSKVNTEGCVVFSLPANNNKVSVTSASCIGTSDGSIGLSIEDASFDYSITVTGKDDPIVITDENKTASVSGLAKGTYSVCFKVTGQDAYEQCFEVVIGEPKALSAFIDVDNDKRTTSIQLAGSKSL